MSPLSPPSWLGSSPTPSDCLGFSASQLWVRAAGEGSALQSLSVSSLLVSVSLPIPFPNTQQGSAGTLITSLPLTFGAGQICI